MSNTKQLTQKEIQLSLPDKEFCLELLYLQYPDSRKFTYQMRADMINRMILLQENVVTAKDIMNLEEPDIETMIADLELIRARL